MNFIKAVENAWQDKNSLVCVGLDTDIRRIPAHLLDGDAPVFEFNKAVVDATADLVCAYKPQIAYYSAIGAEEDLELTIGYIHRKYPEIPVILDAKRGDIGSTADMYVKEIFERYQADAATVNPYMGGDTLRPFLDCKDKGVIILCRTSNPGAGDIQDLESNGKKLYRIVAEKASGEWNENGNVLLVVGATYPGELQEIRSMVGEMPLLIPGIGAQGGDIRAVVVHGKRPDGRGMIINSSRAIIYASKGRDFADAARKAALALRDDINQYR